MEITQTGNGYEKNKALGDAVRQVFEKYPNLGTIVLMEDGTHLFTDTDGLQHWSFKFYILAKE